MASKGEQISNMLWHQGGDRPLHGPLHSPLQTRGTTAKQPALQPAT